MSTAEYTSTFYLNRHSRESAQSQWVRHLQSNAYIRTIGDVVERNRVGLERTIKAASAEQKEALQRVCTSLEDGFAHVSKHLEDINFSISELRGEISEMASMLDWRLSELVEEQRVTNQLLGRVAELLRIPDSQKQRVYHIEQGLKYLKNAIIEGDVDSAFYDDALEELTRAETIERKDYITLGRLGHVYLYSRRHMNIALAEQYFLKAAREALAESNARGTTTAVHLRPRGHEAQIYGRDPFRAAAAEAYLYAGRAAYLQNKLPDAANLAGRAYELVPEFTEAGYEQAKYLSASDRENDASRLLLSIIEQDRYFSLKTLADPDLAERAPVLEMLRQLQARTLAKAEEEYQRCATQAARDSSAASTLSAIKELIAKRDLLDCLTALDQLTATYQLPYTNTARMERSFSAGQPARHYHFRRF